MMRLGGVILVALGALALLYGGFRYTMLDRVVDVGPVKIDVERSHSVPIAPLAGLLVLAAGATMLVVARQRV
jgi:hypothetical protein